MKKHWVRQCETIAASVKENPGKLIGVAVDDDAKADAYIGYWEKHHPHVEVIQRVVNKSHAMPFVLIQIRLKGAVH